MANFYRELVAEVKYAEKPTYEIHRADGSTVAGTRSLSENEAIATARHLSTENGEDYRVYKVTREKENN